MIMFKNIDKEKIFLSDFTNIYWKGVAAFFSFHTSKNRCIQHLFHNKISNTTTANYSSNITLILKSFDFDLTFKLRLQNIFKNLLYKQTTNKSSYQH